MNDQADRMSSLFWAAHQTAVNISVWERDEPWAPQALKNYAIGHGLVVDSRELPDGQVVLYVERRPLVGARYRNMCSIDVYLTFTSSDAYLLTKTLPSSDGK